VIPVVLRTERLVLDRPTLGDVDAITAACQDPLFEQYLMTPWPYRREDAVGFVSTFVPDGWSGDQEYTWAIRERVGGPLIGVVGIRRRDDGSAAIGYWMAAESRGHGFMTESARAVVDWAIAERSGDPIGWEAVVGNAASRSVARKLGFRLVDTRPHPLREGRPDVPTWFGELRADDDRTPKEWPG
jgi:RimJ/RimL family protein N-acetyltransferase